MSSDTFDPSKYSVRERATATIDFATHANADFSPPTNAAIQFRVILYPNGYVSVDSQNVLLYLEITKMDRHELPLYCRVYLLSVMGQRRFLKGFDWTFSQVNQYFSLPLISLYQLTKSAGEFKPNRHPKVVVEVSILDGSGTSSLSSSLSNDFESLLKTAKFTDVTLHVKGIKRFKAHKAIISARSPVFALMFEHDCKESRQNYVEIPNIEVEVFQELLRFLYTDRVHSLGQHAADLYLAANQYQVEPLKELCVDGLIEAISVDTIVKLLIFANSYSIDKLHHHCLVFFANHHRAIMATEDWSSPLLLKPHLLIQLLKQLSVHSSEPNPNQGSFRNFHYSAPSHFGY